MTKTIILSKRDQEAFAAAINNPEPPNDALKQAVRRFKRNVFGEKEYYLPFEDDIKPPDDDDDDINNGSGNECLC